MEGSVDVDRWRVGLGTRPDLAAMDTADASAAPGDKEATEAASDALRDELAGLQRRLWAESRQSLLVVLQAMDAGGKDGTIRKVFRGVNPQGVRVEGFRAPTEDELDHDFLWRVHAKTPRRGEITIFNRSHYEDVVAVRVRGLAPREVWSARPALINAFEQTLAHGRTRVVKLFLHISKDEQRRRLQKRLDDPAKRFKFRREDLEDRKLWDAFQEAYADAIAATSTEQAPWFIVPADRKWFRNWVVLNVIVQALREMDPRFPEPEEDLTGIVIE